MKLAEQIREEIYKQCLENTKSFFARKEYVIEQIKGGAREVYFTLSKWHDGIKPASRDLLDKIGVPSEYVISKGHCLEGHGIFYRNGKHYIEVSLYENKIICPQKLDAMEYCVEDEDGFWRVDYVYNREELLDLGAYFEKEGFRVFVNLCSDLHARYPYKMDAFNIDSLIVTL